MKMEIVAKDSVPQVSHPWSEGLVDYKLGRINDRLFINVQAGIWDARTSVRGNASNSWYRLCRVIEEVGQWTREDAYWGKRLQRFLPGSTVNIGFTIAALRGLGVLEATEENTQADPRGKPSRPCEGFEPTAWTDRMLGAEVIGEEEVPREAIVE